MVAKGSPKWLPSGWNVQYQTQKTGRKIRCYKNMESGKSFYSKDDVIGYIRSTQSQKPLPTSRRTKTQSENSRVQLIEKTNDHPEWLPDGWNVESRTRMSGTNVGSVYKCYIDPMTGNRFYSKPEVFRYLRTVRNKLCTLKERRTSNSPSSKTRVVIEHYKDEDLPPGWIKEIKIRKKAAGVRKDHFYIDPKNGYVFRSKKDVLRYLETGEISKHTFKPKEGHDNDPELIDEKISPSTAKGKLQKSAAIPQHFAGEEKSKESSSKLPGDHLPQIGQINVADEEKSKESNSELPGDHLPQMGQCGNASAELKDTFPPPVETVKKKDFVQEQINEEHTESNKIVRVSPNNGLISTSASESHQEKALPEAENPESNKIEISPDNTPLSTTAPESQQQKIVVGNMMESSEITEPKTKSRKSKKKKDIDLPRRSSKRLAGLKQELVPSAETIEVPTQVSNGNCFDGVSRDADLPMKENEDKTSQQLDMKPEIENKGHEPNFVDFSLHAEPSNKRKTPPGYNLDAPEEQILRGQSEKMDEGETEAELCVPIAEFWSDPCLEFAIKTLTGALPVENATATDGSVSYSTDDTLLGKNLSKMGPGSSMHKKTQVNKKFKNKKELTSNRQSPSINGLKPHLASGVMACKQAKLNSNEVLLSFNLVDSGGYREPPYKNETEKSNKTDECREKNQMVLEDQHQKLQTNELEIPSFPFGDSWSDPCLDFAFKTLTGAIPIEDSLGIQSFFEERLEPSCSQKDGVLPLPDFGSPSLFQNDISSNFNRPEKSVSGQHLSLASQQSCFDRNVTFKGR